jgi:hypothetical protein
MPDFSKSRYADQVMKDFGFSDFNNDFARGSFGFNNSFKYISKRDSFVIFSVPVPVLKKIPMKICSHCQGNKEDLFGTCLFCNGSGEEMRMKVCSYCNGEKINYFGEDCKKCNSKGEEPDSYMDWKPFQAIASTFMVFFGVMFFGAEKNKLTSCNFSQLIFIESYICREMMGAPLGGTYGLLLMRWFVKNPGKIVEVEMAMIKTYRKIYGEFNDYDKMNTWAKVREGGWFSMNCLGDRTGLFPETHFCVTEGQGYGFSCHNLDTTAQQLTLLAGLGALCDKVRKEI